MRDEGPGPILHALRCALGVRYFETEHLTPIKVRPPSTAPEAALTSSFNLNMTKYGVEISDHRPAVFFDRDGTLIEQVPYLIRPDQVRLLPGAADAVLTLRQAGYACVIATNQSAIGRGLMTEDDLQAVHREMCGQFAEQNVVFDAIYHCPTAPTVPDRSMIKDWNRKPGPGMLLKAAKELGLDLSRSWMIGDVLSDMLAGNNAGCHGAILVETGHGLRDDEFDVAQSFVKVENVVAAAQWILGEMRKYPMTKE